MLTWHMAITRLCPMVHGPKNIRFNKYREQVTISCHRRIPYLYIVSGQILGFILVSCVFCCLSYTFVLANWLAKGISLYFVFLDSFLIHFNFCFTVLFSSSPPTPPPPRLLFLPLPERNPSRGANCARIQSPLTGVKASFKVGMKWS
jgi:hypothetical protein